MECKGRPKWRDATLTKKAPYKRNGQPPPGVERGLVRLALNLQETAARQGADFRSAKAFEQHHAPVAIAASGGLRADEYELGGVTWMARGVSQRDHAAKRGAQNDRTSDAHGIAERPHVIAPLRQIPAFPRTILASTVTSMVQIDDLSDISRSGVCRPVDRVVGAGATMKHEQCRLFPHGGTVWGQLAALNVEEQPHPVNEYMHGQASLRQVSL